MIGKKVLIAMVALLGSMFLPDGADAQGPSPAELILIVDKALLPGTDAAAALANLRDSITGKPNSEGIIAQINSALAVLAAHRTTQTSVRAIAATISDEPVSTLLESDAPNDEPQTKPEVETLRDAHYWGYRSYRRHRSGYRRSSYRRSSYRRRCYNKCRNVTQVVPGRQTFIDILQDFEDTQFLCFDELCQLIIRILVANNTQLNADPLFDQSERLLNATRELLNNLRNIRNQTANLPDIVTRVCNLVCYNVGYRGGYYGDSQGKRSLLSKKMDLGTTNEADDEPDYEPKDDAPDDTLPDDRTSDV